jgi:hypothetical protein
MVRFIAAIVRLLRITAVLVRADRIIIVQNPRLKILVVLL